MRVSLALAVVMLTAGLAGCIGDITDDGSDAPSNASSVHPTNAPRTGENEPALDKSANASRENATRPRAPAFETPTSMPHEGWTAEPTIEPAEDGTLYATAPGLFTGKPNMVEGAAYLWKSTDGGESWQTLRDPGSMPYPPDVPSDQASTTACSCDADVETSPDGWVYYADMWDAGAFVETQGAFLRNVLVEASPDGGETWTKAPVPVPQAVPQEGSLDRPWLLVGENGFVGIFYAFFPGVNAAGQDAFNQPSRIDAVYSTDHGQTWRTPTTVVDDGDPNTFTQISKPVNLGNGTLALAYGEHQLEDADSIWRAPGEVKVAVSTDRGASWKQRSIAEVPGGFDQKWAVQATGDAAGSLHVAWSARTNETMTVYHASTQDLGETVEGPTPIRSAGLNFQPWIDARGDGQVAVGFYGGNATGKPSAAGENATWHAYVAERESTNATFATAQVSEDPVKVGPFCPRNGCDGDDELLDFVGFTYDADGRLHYGFARSYTADEDQSTAAIVYHAAEKPAQDEGGAS